ARQEMAGHRGRRMVNVSGEEVYPLTQADQETEPSEEAVEINLSECVEPLRITEGGEYVLSGTLYDSLIIDVKDQLVHLFLNGCTIRSGSGPALNIFSAGKVIITLVEGTESTVRDSQNYHNYDIYSAAISAPCDLTINGTGSLFAYGFYKDAIKSQDILKINGGTYFIQAKRDGLRGNDGLVLAPEKMTVETERNGLTTTKSQKRGKGDMDIRSGEIMVTSGKYAVSCSADLYLRTQDLKTVSVYGDYEIQGRTFDLREEGQGQQGQEAASEEG
ncbi:MAG: carbohydrate-binding domain-containing protein, partial [Lachnospiraceae bacterium]|nr:carbohydrate-binding domain-containing protein [Lachnospiraceae bacterium]